MRFRLTFKTPDVCDQIPKGIDEENDAAHELALKFLKYEEYITIEFDTDKGTAIVVQPGK